MLCNWPWRPGLKQSSCLHFWEAASQVHTTTPGSYFIFLNLFSLCSPSFICSDLIPFHSKTGLRFKFWFHCFPVWPWVKYLSFLSLAVFIFRMGTKMLPGYSKDEIMDINYLAQSPTLSKCSLNGIWFYYCICNNKSLIPGRDKALSDSFLPWRSTVPLNASVPQGSARDSLLSTVTSLLFSVLQTPLNKLFQFSACLLPMKEAMWSHYLLTKGIPGLNWAPHLMLALLYSHRLLLLLLFFLLGCVVLYCPQFPSHSPPPLLSNNLSSLSPCTDLHPGLGQVTLLPTTILPL